MFRISGRTQLRALPRLIALPIAIFAVVPPGAVADLRGSVVSESCTEMATFLGVPKDLVETFVPRDVQLTQSPFASPGQRSQWRPDGREEVDLAIRAIRCDRQRVARREASDRTLVQVGAVIKPYRATNPAVLDVHTFYWASDNRALVEWLHEVRGTQAHAKYSRDLDISTSPIPWTSIKTVPGYSSRLAVQDPELGPFSLAYTASEPLVPTPLRVNWWMSARGGKLLLANTLPAFLSGHVFRYPKYSFEFAPGSDLAQMLRDGWNPGGAPSLVFGSFDRQLTTRKLVK